MHLFLHLLDCFRVGRPAAAEALTHRAHFFLQFFGDKLDVVLLRVGQIQFFLHVFVREGSHTLDLQLDLLEAFGLVGIENASDGPIPSPPPYRP